MTWVKLDDGFADHPKVTRLSAAAFRLHVTALCYAARHNTDGRIERSVLTALHGTRREAAELERAQIWERGPSRDGWLIHDYLEYNPSAAETANARRGARDRMHTLRATRGARRLLPPDAATGAGAGAGAGAGDISDPPEPVRLNMGGRS